MSQSYPSYPYSNEDANSVPSSEESSALRQYAPDELADDILLSTVDGVGPLTTERLLERFGSASEALRAPISELMQVEKVGESLARKIANANQNVDVDAIIRFCEENAITILTLQDVRYPKRLREIATPPRLLYVRGEFKPEDNRAISVVGTRSATNYGRSQTNRIVRQLVEAGFTIVSGLALGIDGYAHRAALNAKGRTIAVLGGGVARIYPREHEDLAARVMNSGAIISEYHPLTTPLSGNFPARNRIVSGLSIGVLVVESGRRGGSMITARFAAEQNRELYAVPGPVDSPVSQGCHELLRDGAILVETVEDILSSLPSYEIKPLIVDELKRINDDRIAEGTAGITERSIASIARAKPPAKSKPKRAPKKAEPERSLLTPIPSNNAEELKPEPSPLPPLSEAERAIVEQVGDKTVSIDELIRAVKLPASSVLGTITALEFKKVLRRCAGNAVARR